MSPRKLHAALAAALPPAAQEILAASAGRIDAADAFIACAERLTAAQARSRARNAARWGHGWSHRHHFTDLIDDAAADQAGDPLAWVLAHEAVAERLAAPGAAQDLYKASLREADTAELAAAAGLTRRRMQQIRAEALRRAARQSDLFGGDE